ncbi:hypothetical protein [Saccharicrinis aurantiacus]|uniref:hypothetical protein n=1 Tax=Saccharicrinis aurantiacus TaxID=1849719 RepID=UPI0024928AFC|nr:hypothetical protein [Saccharicrinis aurantiacus]
MKIYRYLYYNLFLLWLKKKDEPENAHINAVITITFLLYTNLMSIPLSLVAIFKNEIIAIPEINTNVKIWIAIFLIGVGILNYMLLGRKREHNKIVTEFMASSKRIKRNSFYYTLLYIVTSLSIPFYIFFFTTPC